MEGKIMDDRNLLKLDEEKRLRRLDSKRIRSYTSEPFYTLEDPDALISLLKALKQKFFNLFKSKKK